MAFTAIGCNRTNPISQPIMSYKTGVLNVGNNKVTIEIAESVAAQDLGLGGRDSLAENSGMLFVFSAPGQYGFWMKDMKFPLDFVWIKDGKVSQITANVPDEPGVATNQLRTYLPDNPVDSMLEVNAGWASRHNVKVGDPIVMQ